MVKTTYATTIQIVSQDQEFTDRFIALADAMEQEPGLSCRVSTAERLPPVPIEMAHLVIVDLDSLTDEGLKQIEAFREQGGRSWVVVAYRTPSPERLVKAMRAGANDYLSPKTSQDDFTSILRRALEHQGHPAARMTGRLVTVFSNKGGVGATTVAINLAASLAAQRKGSVAVVDLVLQHGDLSVFLDVPTNYTVAHLTAQLDRADSSYLHSVLPKHASGVYVLPAPYLPDEAELMSSDQVSRMLQTLCQAFDVVVVDAGNEFTDSTLTALELSDHLFLVTLPNLPAVRNTKRTLELFGQLNYDPSKVVIIVNRYDSKEQLSQKTIEEALGRAVQWTIPNTYFTVARAINQGTAVRLVQPKGPFSANIDRLAQTYVGDHHGQAHAKEHQRRPVAAGSNGGVRGFFRRRT